MDSAQNTNEGARLLAEKLHKRGTTQKQLAVEMAAGNEQKAKSLESQISRWGSGKAKPKTAERMWMHKRLGIHWETWDREPGGSGEHAAVTPPKASGDS